MRVRQIVRNLLSNVAHHGGEIVRVTSEEVGNVVQLVVADNGDGVAPSKAVRLFTRYVHEGEDPLTVGSVGLGLAVVKILAEGMDGQVRYEREGGWSRFIVDLPAREGSTGVRQLPRVEAQGSRSIAASSGFELGPADPFTRG